MRKLKRTVLSVGGVFAASAALGVGAPQALGVGPAVCYFPNVANPCGNYGGLAPGGRDYENFVSGQTTGTFMATQSTTIGTGKRVAVTNGLTPTPIAGPWSAGGTDPLRVEWSLRDWKSFWCENYQLQGNIAARCGYYT